MLTAEPRHLEVEARPARLTLFTLFVLLGLLVWGGLVFWVQATGALVVEEPTLTAVMWRFLNTVGIVRPLLLVFAGGMLLRLSIELRAGDISAARWGLLIFNWLVAAAVFMVFVGPLITWMRPATPADEKIRAALLTAAPYVGLLLVSLVLRTVVSFNARHYRGEEDINRRNARRAWNLLIPTLIVFLAIAVTPLERVFITSLTDERFASSSEVNFVGFQNYTQLWSLRLDTVPCEVDDNGACLVDDNGNVQYPRLRRYFPEDDPYVTLRYRDMTEFDLFGQHWVISARDREFVSALVTSVYYTVLAIALQFTLGFFMAMIIAQRTRGIGLLRVVMLVPMAIPTLIASQFWEVMLRSDATGLFNALLLALGVIDAPKLWLLDPALQVPTLVAVIVWKETPITALLLLPGLLAIPREVYQAGAIDGANRLQRFFAITLPIMRPTIGVVLVLRTMLFLRVFDLFDILVGETRFVMATYAHNVLIQQQQLGYSSAISVTIFVVTMIFTIAYMRTLRIDEA